MIKLVMLLLLHIIVQKNICSSGKEVSNISTFPDSNHISNEGVKLEGTFLKATPIFTEFL